MNNVKLSLQAKRQIGNYLREKYDTTSQIKIAHDGAVTIHVDKMPNTNQSGWIFVGWDTELLNESDGYVNGHPI
jgi:hypothetical protein